MSFGLFKKKNTPEPIFSVLGTDMHCHLVPAVDDGSKSMEESIECLKTLSAVGYKKVIITPHFCVPRYPNDEDDIVRRYEELQRQAEAAGVGIELAGIGGEYRLDTAFRSRMENARFLKVADQYVLVEFSLHQPMKGAEELIFDMQMNGYEIILAHPERYPYMNIDGTMMEQMLNQGVYLQCNVLSLGGFYGEEAKRRAFTLIERGWVGFLGTDTHNVLYAQALRDITFNRKVQKILKKYKFLNNTI